MTAAAETVEALQATGARTIHVNTVTLHRNQIAAICAEWARLQRMGAVAPWPPRDLNATAAGFIAADWLIELACKEAAGQIPPVKEAHGMRLFMVDGADLQPALAVVRPGAPPAEPGPGDALDDDDRRLLARLCRLDGDACLIPSSGESLASADILLELGYAERPPGKTAEAVRATVAGRALAQELGL